LRQLRQVVGFDHVHRYLIHDRDSIFARSLDESMRKLGWTALKSPPHSPQANAICERVTGSIRRECLDWLIPLSESRLRHHLPAIAPASASGCAPDRCWPKKWLS
jgi:hypothetical protein